MPLSRAAHAYTRHHHVRSCEWQAVAAPALSRVQPTPYAYAREMMLKNLKASWEGQEFISLSPVRPEPRMQSSLLRTHHRHVDEAFLPRRACDGRTKAVRSVKIKAAGTTTEISKKEYVTFTNTSGRVLRKIASNVWAADRPFLWNGIDVGGRMAVLRLSDGSIWVHSPVSLDDDLAAALAELGEVKHIVSPNYEHTEFAQQWRERYPAARSYACPGLPKKMPEVPFHAEVGMSGADPDEWLGEIQSTWLSYEHNPFTRTPFFSEVVFFFKPARLLVASDLFWNYPGDRNVGFGTKLWKTGMDKLYLPFYRSFMIKDQGLYAKALERIFKWDFDSILPCHGDYVPEDGKRVLQEHLELVGERKRLISQ